MINETLYETRDVELPDMWTPNPDKTLSTAEHGVHVVAERYAYDKTEREVCLPSEHVTRVRWDGQHPLPKRQSGDLAVESALSESDDVCGLRLVRILHGDDIRDE
ncbi:hypothetical protein [Halorubrum sp. PV6]|uniref:hypothetical protein n=1 Tax=Halorubrum sp. PV6 TaxID=634157 RepID=UPI0014481D4D|nr:hypothetical protein [Halorubrum sp. PV6]